MDQADKIIKNLNLIPHPEGGFFSQTYLDDEDFKLERKIASVIYFLLKFSRVRKLMWSFHNDFEE